MIFSTFKHVPFGRYRKEKPKIHPLLLFQSNEARMPDGGFALLSTAAQNALAHCVTAVSFDPYQELLWTGNNMVIALYNEFMDYSYSFC